MLNLLLLLFSFFTATDLHAAEPSCAILSVTPSDDCHKLKLNVDYSQCPENFKTEVPFEACSVGAHQVRFEYKDSTYLADVNTINGPWGGLEHTATRVVDASSGKPTKEKKTKVAEQNTTTAPGATGVAIKAKSVAKVIAPQAATPASETQTSSSASAAAPSAGTQATATAAPSAQVAAAPLFQVYGFLIPSVNHSTNQVASFGRANMSAPTEAQSTEGRARSSFQVQQSRLGVRYNPSPDVKGQVEIDFADFQKASPTTQSNPRLRMAKISYEPIKQLTIFAGQDWDIFSPLNPFGYNFVGANFRGGNAGFFRQQLGVIAQPIAGFEVAGSVGFPTPNANQNDQAPEIESQPAFSLRLAYIAGTTRMGVSGIMAKYGYTGTTTIDTVRQSSNGVNIFAESSFDAFEAKIEAYQGRNLANLNLLTLSQASLTVDTLDEVGGYASIRYKLPRNAIWFTWGKAAILESNKIQTNSAGANGIKSNEAGKIGIDQTLSDKLKAYYELSRFKTTYATATSEAYLHSVGFQLVF